MAFDSKDKLKLVRQIALVYQKFSERADLHDSQVFLSYMLVARAIDNASRDIKRMAAFHLEADKLPDRHKIAGFVSRWIAKERPIQLIGNPPLNLVTDQLIWANAQFAVFVMSSFLRGGGVPAHLGQHLKYWFAFRDERGETLSLVAYCCEQMRHDALNNPGLPK